MTNHGRKGKKTPKKKTSKQSSTNSSASAGQEIASRTVSNIPKKKTAEQSSTEIISTNASASTSASAGQEIASRTVPNISSSRSLPGIKPREIASRVLSRRISASASRSSFLRYVFMILTTLPVKMIRNLMSVSSFSKTWRSVISDPDFIQLHLIRSRSVEALIIHVPMVVKTDESMAVKTDEKSEELQSRGHIVTIYNAPQPNALSTMRLVPCPNTDVPGFTETDMVGSCNGVVLWVQGVPWAKKITFWNPSIHVTKPIIPSGSFPPNPSLHRLVSIGLGFDKAENDFKVIRILCMHRKFRIPEQAEIYSLRTGQWKMVRNGDNRFSVHTTKCDAVVRGEPYWRVLMRGNTGLYFSLMYFNFETESFCVVSLPVRLTSDTCICEINSALAMVVVNQRGNDDVGVWMKCDRFGWTCLYKLDRKSVMGKVVSSYADMGIVEMVGGEGNLLMYNMEKRQVEDLINIEDAKPHAFNVVRYRESLVGIDAVNRIVMETDENSTASEEAAIHSMDSGPPLSEQTLSTTQALATGRKHLTSSLLK